MKKRALFIVAVLLMLVLVGINAGEVQAMDDLAINEENFPAEWLRNLLKTKYYDLDGNGVLSGQEIEQIRMVGNFTDVNLPAQYDTPQWVYVAATSTAIISGTDLSGKDVLDTRGLEKLVFCERLNLAEITCNQFTVSPCPESLTSVVLTNADMNLLKIAGEGIRNVYFPSCDPLWGDLGWGYDGEASPGFAPIPVNHVKQLDVSKCPNLQTLFCDSPALTAVDVRQNKNLKQLSCEGNQLTELDVSNNVKLESLMCRYNQLEELDVEQNRQLKLLNVKENQLTSLDISNLKELCLLNVAENQLKRLDVSRNKELWRFSCARNQLKKLDLSRNKKLLWVSCHHNKMKTLALPDVNWRKHTSNDEDSWYTDQYYSLFGQNPINTLDLRTVSDFRKVEKKTVLQFMNGKYNWWEKKHHIYKKKRKPLRKIKKLVISRKLSGSDRIWLEKQAGKYRVKIVYR